MTSHRVSYGASALTRSRDIMFRRRPQTAVRASSVRHDALLQASQTRRSFTAFCILEQAASIRAMSASLTFAGPTTGGLDFQDRPDFIDVDQFGHGKVT